MQPIAARLREGVALLWFLMALMLFIVSIWGAHGELEGAWSLCVAYSVCTLTAILVWWRLWRGDVEWSTAVRRNTLLLGIEALWSCGVPLAPPYSTLKLSPLVERIWWVSCCTVPIWMLGAWFIGTALLWRRARSTTLSRELCVTCPRCAADLSAQHRASCPACGWEGVVDDVVRHALRGPTALVEPYTAP
ncbi:MAG: hypothetical protein HUU22_17450 [Phycisphaerae bacterium]|nr:hypothetical protein [Phycisphaerae bacterium]NUQ47808.1 hypothetical protein [Phycisphaerae bacterium]